MTSASLEELLEALLVEGVPVDADRDEHIRACASSVVDLGHVVDDLPGVSRERVDLHID